MQSKNEQNYKTLGIDRYHKIPGDMCHGGFTPDGPRHIDIDKRCKAGDKTYMFEEEDTPAVLPHKSTTTHGKVGTDAVLLAVSNVTVDASSVLIWVIIYLDYGSVVFPIALVANDVTHHHEYS